MKKFKCNGDFTLEIVRKLNDLSKNEDICIVFDNTKHINSEIIRRLNPNITVSIQGGLNPKKDKFNNEHYQKRTYYTPMETYAIIRKFEQIERMVRPNWTDLEKAMFIYKKLCEAMIYDECIYNGKDAARNLLGMVTGKSVCAGFAIIYKEAMDRLDIPCFYQNRRGHHCWNILKTEEGYHSIELTWDTCNKKNNECGFNYFCRENKYEFYHPNGKNHHDISNEDEEMEYPLTKIPVEKLKYTLQKISSPLIYNLEINGDHLESNQIKNSNKIKVQNNTLYVLGRSELTFIRKDSTSFILLPIERAEPPLNIFQFLYIEKRNDKICKGTMIYSENNLITASGLNRENVANVLLSKERIDDKIRNYNGYVGYLMKNSQTKFYNDVIEKSLNIYR